MGNVCFFFANIGNFLLFVKKLNSRNWFFPILIVYQKSGSENLLRVEKQTPLDAHEEITF